MWLMIVWAILVLFRRVRLKDKVSVKMNGIDELFSAHQQYVNWRV